MSRRHLWERRDRVLLRTSPKVKDAVPASVLVPQLDAESFFGPLLLTDSAGVVVTTPSRLSRSGLSPGPSAAWDSFFHARAR